MRPPVESTPAAPAPPPVAGEVFGDALPAALAFVAKLASDGVTRGLIGPREVPRLWERHVLNSAAVAEAVGISRITARRYLEHLVQTGRAARRPLYGQVGRPELVYRWVTGTGGGAC